MAVDGIAAELRLLWYSGLTVGTESVFPQFQSSIHQPSSVQSAPGPVVNGGGCTQYINHCVQPPSILFFL